MITTPDRPCDVIRRHLSESGMTQGQLAQRLGVDPRYASNLLRGRIGISADMAVKLAAAFEGMTAEEWGRVQSDYEIAKARERADNGGVYTS